MSTPGTVGHFFDHRKAEKQAAEHHVDLDPATLAQLRHQARKYGITVGQMIASYVRDGLLSDFYANDPTAMAQPTTDPVQRKKNRLYWRYHDGKIKLRTFQKLAAKIDGGEWAVPLYTYGPESDHCSVLAAPAEADRASELEPEPQRGTDPAA